MVLMVAFAMAPPPTARSSAMASTSCCSGGGRGADPRGTSSSRSSFKGLCAATDGDIFGARGVKRRCDLLPPGSRGVLVLIDIDIGGGGTAGARQPRRRPSPTTARRWRSCWSAAPRAAALRPPRPSLLSDVLHALDAPPLQTAAAASSPSTPGRLGARVCPRPPPGDGGRRRRRPALPPPPAPWLVTPWRRLSARRTSSVVTNIRDVTFGPLGAVAVARRDFF